MNVVEPILFQCKLNPLAVAICVPGSKDGSVTYGILEQLIHNVGRSALKSGIAPGTLVAIYIKDTISHIAVILGLMHIGAATLSLREPKPIKGIKSDVIITDAPGAFSGTETVLAFDQSWLEGDGVASQTAAITGGTEEDICRIILTSGSTGVSKGVAFSHRALEARIGCDLYQKGPRYAHCPRFFCDLGIATSPGFRYAMVFLSCGGTIYFLGPDPLDILQTLDLHKVQGMATSPFGLAEFLKYFEADAAFDVTFDHIICQGAMLSRVLSQRVRARMCHNLYSSYGSTEVKSVAFGPASVLESIPGAVGYIQPGVTAEIIDKSGMVLPPLKDGALRVRTAHMATGYVGDEEATQTFFRDGYFYIGDIGHLTPDGLLVITGREKTALNVGGDTVSPELVEDVITSFTGIQEAGVFAQNNDLGVAELCALIVTRQAFNESALRQHCASRLPPSFVPSRFVIVDMLPRGGQGKIERHRLPDFALAKDAPA